MSNTKTIEEALTSCILNAMRSLHVGMPGRVESYNSATQRAVVLPLIMPGYVSETGAIDWDDLKPLSDVPVKFLRSAAFSLTFPIAKGDLVHLQFTDFSIDEWLKEGGVRKPANHRNHDISDAVCCPSLYHNATDQVHSTDAVLAGNLRLGSKDASELAAFQSELLALRNWAATHTHTTTATVSTGAVGTLAAPSSPPTPVGATKVWVE